MAGRQIDRLVRMANQIALNMSGWGEAELVAARIGEHLTKFWTPDMRTQLLGYHRAGGEELSPVVEEALRLVAGET